MPKECLFCLFRKEPNLIIFDNEYFYAMFDQCPVSPGHALVIPKRHVLSILNLTGKEWVSMKDAINKTIKIIEKTDLRKMYENMAARRMHANTPWFCDHMLMHSALGKKPDGYNIGNNDGRAAGRTIDHVHIQIIPRYKGDVKNPRGGIRNIIPGMGDYKEKKD